MTREKIFEKVKQVFEEVLEEIEVELTEQSTAEDVEYWDSITHMEIISELENVFSIEFTFEEIEELKVLGDMISLIESKTE